jgi:hypothetical protein
MNKGELGETCSTNEENRNVYKILVIKAMEKLVLGDVGAIGKIILK